MGTSQALRRFRLEGRRDNLLSRARLAQGLSGRERAELARIEQELAEPSASLLGDGSPRTDTRGGRS